TDVVPVGDKALWTHEPFGGEIVNDKLYGRGAADRKGGVADFVAAVASFVNTWPNEGSISLIITGDEEGDAEFGTVKMVEWMTANDQVPDFCLVGEPTNPTQLGDIEEHFARVGGAYKAEWRVSAHPFVTPVGNHINLVCDAIEAVTGQVPELSTSGGTSDARFITTICPVAEFGLVGKTMHQVDEYVDVGDIDRLAKIYENVLNRFFKVER
ncbi:MAG: M20/M25/M40 family metallo-hydrolase, partial [Opitutae bacterium]